ncbi:hypothetical protein KY495_13485 [Massilia sp. PAMC28688]|nr:hypothetical protein KY495_13485 [Massilia sp. PAMC28688]
MRVLAAALLLGAAGGALAHRFHFGIAEMSENPRSGSVEIIHTLMAHDVDALLARRHKRQVDLSTPEDEALLRAYTDEKFYVLGKDGKRLPLKWVGMTASVENVVIYQELDGATLTDIARVHDELLVDFLPRQVNTVNVRRGANVVSLAFDRKNPERKMK